MGKHKKEIIWILVPFIYGFIVNHFILILPTMPPFLIQIIFGVFWFWVGMRFAKFEGNHVKNILVGNSIWLISFLMFIWQFVLVHDENRNSFFASLSQHYPLSFLWSGRELSLLFSNTLHGTVIINSYFMMLLVFIAGYIMARTRGS